MERILAALCCITLMTSLWSGRVLSDQESAANNLDDKLDSAVAEIYNQDKKLIGTGTVVSLSGMILTAKHILEDPDVGGSSAASYLATVQVSFKGKKDYLDAELRAVHPFL